MSEEREQRLARIENLGRTMRDGMSLTDDEIDFLLGEARRVTQLEAERDTERERIAAITEDLGTGAKRIADERNAAVAALTRIRELCDSVNDTDWVSAQRLRDVLAGVGVADTTEADR